MRIYYKKKVPIKYLKTLIIQNLKLFKNDTESIKFTNKRIIIVITNIIIAISQF